LARHNSGYHLSVTDNGRGFDRAPQGKKSLGLIGIRERVLRLGGELKIDSAPGGGTRLEVILPR
jgi:signal transduction histidine kinase